MELFRRLIIKLLTAIVLSLFLAALFSLVVYWAWNAVMPELFHLPSITLYQALVLTLLCSFLSGPRSSSS